MTVRAWNELSENEQSSRAVALALTGRPGSACHCALVRDGGQARRPSSTVTYSALQTAFTSVYCSKTSWPISRPQPDCLYPPKGRAASKML